jgi:TonB family protein
MHIDEQKTSRRLWVFAGICALALHLGGAALAISHLQAEEADDALGAQAIEIGLEMAAVHREVTDLPPGPDTDASTASPQLAEQKAEVKETDLPQDKPTETEEADRVVTETESKKPKEDDPKIAAVQTSASTESVAAEATATPSSEAIPEGPRSIAPAIGTGETARRVRATWQKELVAHLDKHKKYPSERSQKAAEIYVRFTLDRLGHVLATSIEKGSGDTAFDAAALAMVRRSDPVPAPPPLIADEVISSVIAREGGRSSTPETLTIEPRSRGVLDPRMRGDDSNVERLYRRHCEELLRRSNPFFLYAAKWIASLRSQ